MAHGRTVGTQNLSRRTIILLVGILVALLVVPLVMNSGGQFQGTDDAAREEIAQVAPGAHPWAAPLWAPPSDEVESLLFALQAAVGGAVVGYIFGTMRERGRIRSQRQAGTRSTNGRAPEPVRTPREEWGNAPD